MILHIPHSSTLIPASYPKLDPRSVDLYTDHATDRLFEYSGAERFVFPYSRFFVDVERFLDDPLEEEGHGWFYTHDYHGNNYRDVPGGEELDYFTGWHSRIRTHVEAELARRDRVVLVDCHSFGAWQVPHASPESLPDVCIGVNDDGSTPGELRELVTRELNALGYRTVVNFPYPGSMKFSERPGFETVMIEVNKRVYLDRGDAWVERVRADIGEVLRKIKDYEGAP